MAGQLVRRVFICQVNVLTSRHTVRWALPHNHERPPILAHGVYRQSLYASPLTPAPRVPLHQDSG